MQKNILAIILLLTIVSGVVLSIFIPVLSNSPKTSSISFNKLYPLYYQTNTDSPLELRFALGFPKYYKTSFYRINRPLIAGIAKAGTEFFIWPITKLFAGKKIKNITWGKWPAAKHISVYFIWILINIFFYAASIILYSKIVDMHFSYFHGFCAALMLALLPLTIYGIRLIHYNSLQLFIIVISITFWMLIIEYELTIKQICIFSLIIGTLFLGKLSISTFAAGLVICFFSKKRKKLLYIIPFVFLPYLIWIFVLYQLDIKFVFPEVIKMNSGLWVLKTQDYSFISKFICFLKYWIKSLSENLSIVHYCLIFIGLISFIINKKISFIFISIAFMFADLIFYFLLNKANGLYALHSVVFLLVFASQGVFVIINLLKHRLKIFNNQNIWGCIFILILQICFIILRLPNYK